MSAELLLGPMLRFVSDTEATIWMETTTACGVRVLDTTTHTFEVHGHHYALVVLTALEPGSVTEYGVELDGRSCWPPADSTFPPSIIRTQGHDRRVMILFGSCRAAAPHEPPYILLADEDPKGRGVDALRANGLRMLRQDPSEWPDALALLGDQVYADDMSPATERRIEARKGVRDDLPENVVADFQEYAWLYEEAWTPDVERWVFSVLPSMMIFDDHDVIDDWNTSQAWVDEIRGESWWEDHIIGAMMSYWIYQHLGNLSPAEIESEGMLAELLAAADAEAILRRWAFQSESQTPVPGGYQFSFWRQLDDVLVVMIDVRNGRVLADGQRRMVDEGEWAWIVDACSKPCRHLIIANSLPVFTPGGIHALQQWTEAIGDGAWGRPGRWIGEKVRRVLDTEHWPGFDTSFREIEQLLLSRGAGRAHSDHTDDGGVPPETITVLGGDIHFSYAVRIEPREEGAMTSRVHQVISSPIRNILAAKERKAMRFALSGSGRRLGEFFQHRVHREPSALHWDLDIEPIFDNTMALLAFTGDQAHLVMERAHRRDDGTEWLEIFEELDL